MGWLSKLFGKNKRESSEETSKIEQKPIEEVLTTSEEICEYCKMPIQMEQKIIHKFGKAYHNKPCWRTLQKLGHQEMGI